MYKCNNGKKLDSYKKVHLLVPVGEGHHDVERGQKEVKMKERIAIGDPILFIIHHPPQAILAHFALHIRVLPFLCLHQPIHLSVAGGADTARREKQPLSNAARTQEATLFKAE